MPFRPAATGDPNTPLILRFRNVTVLPAAEMMIPLVPEASVDATWPPPPSIVIDLVIVTAPKPPGSKALISPPAAVLEIAPAKVLQGAVRLQGLASSPTPETHVRVAWALAGCTAKARDVAARAIRRNLFLSIGLPSKDAPSSGRWLAARNVIRKSTCREIVLFSLQLQPTVIDFLRSRSVGAQRSSSLSTGRPAVSGHPVRLAGWSPRAFRPSTKSWSEWHASAFN